MTFEQLVLLLLFIVFPLLQRLGPWLRTRMEEMERRAGQAAEPTDPRPKAPSVPVPQVESRPARRPRPRAAVAVETPPPAPRRTRFAAGDLREVRRGIVIMAILGPCRAWSPAEPPGLAPDR